MGASPTMLRKGCVSKLIAAEFKKVGIRVNCIAPGYFTSEMTMKESDEKNKSEMLKEKI
jgi:NAD(P)-dependent dehydrogenase (short-subunit alcohol dehydrogenase family)